MNVDVRQEVIDTGPGMGRGLINHDPRSRAFPARGLLSGVVTPRSKTWRRGLAYDQGRTSQCVAYTGKGILNTSLLSANMSYYKRSRIDTNVLYAQAQQRDEWPGEAYDGTSALGLCRALVDLGLIQEYRWCFGIDDVILTLGHIGPVGIGVWWTNDMFRPDARGFIRPTGDDAGGHEVELIGVDVEEGHVIGMNSWGRDWGDNGRFRMSFADLDSLLQRDGDAVVITR